MGLLVVAALVTAGALSLGKGHNEPARADLIQHGTGDRIVRRLADRPLPGPRAGGVPIGNDGPDAGDVVGEPPAARPAAGADTAPAPDEPILYVVGQAIRAAVCDPYEWDCGTALAIGRCESTDFYAEPWENPGHRGAFQIGAIHAPRFAARGWDWNTDGLMLEVSAAIAYELWSEQGWAPWLDSVGCWG